MPKESRKGYTQSERVASDIARQITNGELKEGERLASETRLASQYGASRGTIRRALAMLQESDLVHTRPGSGSYVAFHGSSLAGPQGWTSATSDVGMPTTVEVLSVSLDKTPTSLAEHTDETECFVVRRRRLLDGEPISLETSVLPANERIRTVMEFGLLGDSVSKTLRATGMRVTNGYQNVSARRVTGEDARLLHAEEGSRMIVSERVGLGADGELVEYVNSWLNPDHFTLHLSFEE
ncbi:GntR family transcriptional regulator [Arcanobacterium haemolyticum]|nr:GntR family transcriptional regulator [Arcanobacterium haemolyticum]